MKGHNPHIRAELAMNGAFQGAYFLANDRVLSLARAFLNSFRMHNPHMALCLIPYDGNSSTLTELATLYQFSVFKDQGILERCDQISRELHGHTVGHYRKLACWHGEFTEFVYIDVDVCLLQDVSFVFEHLCGHDVVTSHSDSFTIASFTWTDAAFLDAPLDIDQISYAANTGFMCSRLSALSVSAAEDAVAGALAHLQCLALLDTAEQPFINWLIVSQCERFTSLAQLDALAFSQGLSTRIPYEFWAGTEGASVSNGYLTPLRGPTSSVLCVHWAGKWQPKNGREHWMNRLFSARSHATRIHARMPYKDLWLYYHDLDPSLVCDPTPNSVILQDGASH